MTYWNDAVKEDNMGDPRRLASAFYRNAIAYGGVVLQIGNAYVVKLADHNTDAKKMSEDCQKDSRYRVIKKPKDKVIRRWDELGWMDQNNYG